MANFRLDVDGDGIALITWDMADRSMNVINLTVIEELSAIVEKVAGDAAIKGAVITGGKDTFCAGADLTMLDKFGRVFAEMARTQGEEAAAGMMLEESRKLSLLYRRLETCGKPWVAAINGTAVGGGFELCLACHHRVAAANPKTRLLVTGYETLQGATRSVSEARSTVEVAHEALIQRWPTLRDWVRANREAMRARAAILRAKAEWEEHGQDDKFLLDPGVHRDRGHRQPASLFGRPDLPDQPGRLPGGRPGQFALLHDLDVPVARPGQDEGHRAADGPAADDRDLSVSDFGHRNLPAAQDTSVQNTSRPGHQGWRFSSRAAILARELFTGLRPQAR